MVDPTILLARGGTARRGGTPLTAEEIKKDLLHCQAYAHAVTRYQQHVYQLHSSTEAAAPRPANLPVTLNPEEESRMALLRKTIARAEHTREYLESTYVALRAHYVYLAQLLQRPSTVPLLQEQVTDKANKVAALRAKVQMARDVLNCLQHRGQLLGESIVPANPSSEDSNLSSLWNSLDDVLIPAKSSTRKVSVVPWNCQIEPATPRGVPLLLSNTSTIPEKSLAWHPNQVQGAPNTSLVWLTSHVPDDEENGESEKDVVFDLREQVKLLELELQQEREWSSRWCDRIAAMRRRQDEAVAMMALVRLETEGVLLRHNIVLEQAGILSDEEGEEDMQEETTTETTKNDIGQEENEEEATRKRETSSEGSSPNSRKRRKL